MAQRLNSRYSLHLGKDCYLFDSKFNGETYIHLRELIFKDGQPIPSLKGITLTLSRCNELYSFLNQITIHVDEWKREQLQGTFRKHLGGNWFVGVTPGFPVVDVRKFWLPEGADNVCATRKGISLTFDQFDELKNGLRMIAYVVPELYNVQPCYLQQGHNTDACQECSPNSEYKQ